ncbi:kelch motif domain-containing protein [Ditylenchus destructor]|nr:kelch motif domain-containing protein [Ditylenchus destructor]
MHQSVASSTRGFVGLPDGKRLLLTVTKVVYVVVFLVVADSPQSEASLQARRPSSSPTKPCDKPCFNGGTCSDGNCVCPPGWTGAQCDSCFGRIRKNATTRGYITDGPVNYSASAKCIWIIEGDGNGPLLLRLEEFFTECCWDHLYIYDGDSVYGNLIAAFSAIVYFISDLAFNLPGFNVSYVSGSCLNNCAGHGVCAKNGKCECENFSYRGAACEHRICLDTMDGKSGPCKNRGYCERGKCVCPSQTHGDNCQELTLNPVWDSLTVSPADLFQPRASHKSVLIGNEIWTFGGMLFNTSRKANDLTYFDITTQEFSLASTSSSPSPRYDHSMIYYENDKSRKIYVFGGVVNENTITNELWSLTLSATDLKWTLISAHDESPSAVPAAVAGHTAHVIGDEMFVFFGYNPFEGFIFRVQIYNFETNKWRSVDIESDSTILGRFGHSSVVFREADKKAMVLLYGGYNAPLNGYSYAISDELLLYDPTEQNWISLGSTGLPLFRHTSVLLDGIMLIVGGNSHNESSRARQNDCYSNQVLAFDTVCKEWLKISINDAKQFSSRYGHSAIANEHSMFVLGGFNGLMHNDVLKFTPAACNTQASSMEECENTANGVRCVFYNKLCKKAEQNTSYRQPFLSFIKSDSPRLQADCSSKRDHHISTCADIKECNDCLYQKGCGWSRCFSGKRRKKLVRPRPCSLATNCFACRQMKHCTWFTNLETKHICVSLADETMLIEEHNRIQAEKLSSASSAALPQSSQLMTSAVQVSSTSRHLMSMDMGSFPLSNERSQSNNTCPLPCSEHINCQTCVQSQCMWCPSTRRCVAMDTYMISFPYGQCQSWVTAANTNHACQLDPYDCEVQKTCSDCQLVGPRCGWCDDGSGTGLGKCLPGSGSEPLQKNLCPASRWFFTGEPSCQCNGHSTCMGENSTVGSRKCRQCADKTRGEHCELCDLGYFGDPRNGGTCKECQCNGQATLCNSETGDCYCSTKGVTGPHCDRCEQKYIGDPKNGRPCTYELVIDFIFTFKLDGEDAKDKYVNKINFFSTPFKALVDVQFSITCEGESGAKVSINLTTNGIDGRPGHSKQLMAGQLCTSTGIKRAYSASDPGYAFGTDANTTFFVKVRDFVTPIKIVISFAQSPPINWVLFFVIFAACFIVLLVVAGLLWMIKLRVEWYRNIRRRHDEIEEMASRPFASVKLDLSSDSTNAAPAPISIEPCGNYQCGIYTLIVRLPTGGRPFTPEGTSGLAVASSLCQLTHSQLALLQPPEPTEQQQQNRKSAFRRFIPFIRSQ